MNADEMLDKLRDECLNIRSMRHKLGEMADEYADVDNMDLSRMRSEMDCAMHKLNVAHDCILSAIIYLKAYIGDGGI